jgi:hypothetical protein
MKDRELNEVLKRAAVPERKADYWERFPSQVTAEISRRRRVSAVTHGGTACAWVSALRTFGSKPAFVLGVAAICLAVGFVLGSWKGQLPPAKDAQLAEARKYFHELEALFPNQLAAIVFDQQGPHMVLAPKPNLPTSPPLYLKICGPKGCQRFVTFSGQQIRVNGDVCDVLVDARGHVLLVGTKLVWTSADTGARIGEYRFAACSLGISS